jgi:hypothetical protein
MKFCSTVLLATIIMCSATAQEAFYLANEGVMVSDGDTRILFDPLYPESYGQYLLVPEEMRRALFAGEAPFDGVDAVFISHFHGDHFSPGDVLALMQAQADIALYAPQQAVLAMRSIADGTQQAVFSRVHAVSLAYGDAPITLEMDELLVEAVRIPHSGWPTGRVDVENIVWRVTLNAITRWCIWEMPIPTTNISPSTRRTGIASSRTWPFRPTGSLLPGPAAASSRTG